MKQVLSVVLLMLLVGVSIQVSVNLTKFSNILQKKVKNSESKFDVIVYLKSSVNFAQYETNANANARATQIVQDLMRDSKQASEEVINLARRQNGNLHVEPLWISNAVVIHGCDLQLLHQLSSLPSVKRIVSDAPVILKPVYEDEPKLVTGSRPNSVEWNVEMIGAKKAWDMGYAGQGIVVGIADTGIDYLHPALVNRYRGLKDAASKTFDHNYNWYDGIRKPIGPSGGKCGINATSPCDDYGHGTHCTGIILGTSPDGSRQFGAAPNATFVGCRNMDQGTGRPSTYINCLQFFMAPTALDGTNPKPELRPHIVSNSYGCDRSEQCEPNSIKEATDAITAAGILMVVAAGNSGPSCSTADSGPGIYGSSFTVGATGYQTTHIASFSSRGPVTADGSKRPKPDISCPGSNIYSTFPNNRYVTMSGTSMATPGVAGCAALLWSAVPSLQRDLAKTIDILEQTALPMPVTECSSSGVPNNVYGYGIVRADEAIKAAQKK